MIGRQVESLLNCVAHLSVSGFSPNGNELCSSGLQQKLNRKRAVQCIFNLRILLTKRVHFTLVPVRTVKFSSAM